MNGDERDDDDGDEDLKEKKRRRRAQSRSKKRRGRDFAPRIRLTGKGKTRPRIGTDYEDWTEIEDEMDYWE